MLKISPNLALRASAVAIAVALVSGCANRDSITVGAVPDDYRTNHPIVISEREKKIDIPVGLADTRMTSMQRTAVDGFVDHYDRRAAPAVSVMVPYGAPNQSAASLVAADMVARLRSRGVPEGKIVHQPYDASQYGDNAPIRLAYNEMTASTGQCGRWPADMLENTANKHWANFGCSYQNNLAAQVANPADFLGPRSEAEIDQQRRSVAFDQYRGRASTWTPETQY
jgi:pilus assembly protein CpaD